MGEHSRGLCTCSRGRECANFLCNSGHRKASFGQGAFGERCSTGIQHGPGALFSTFGQCLLQNTDPSIIHTVQECRNIGWQCSTNLLVVVVAETRRDKRRPTITRFRNQDAFKRVLLASLRHSLWPPLSSHGCHHGRRPRRLQATRRFSCTQ